MEPQTPAPTLVYSSKHHRWEKVPWLSMVLPVSSLVARAGWGWRRGVKSGFAISRVEAGEVVFGEVATPSTPKSPEPRKTLGEYRFRCNGEPGPTR